MSWGRNELLSNVFAVGLRGKVCQRTSIGSWGSRAHQGLWSHLCLSCDIAGEDFYHQAALEGLGPSGGTSGGRPNQRTQMRLGVHQKFLWAWSSLPTCLSSCEQLCLLDPQFYLLYNG